jgi:hexosaminidase
MVDAAVADPRPAREFSRRVDRFLGGKGESDLEELTGQLSRWKENHARVQAIVERSPILREIETLSEDLSNVAALGLEAVDVIQGKSRADASWNDQAKKLLDKAKPQRGELDLAVLPALQKLVDAAAQK